MQFINSVNEVTTLEESYDIGFISIDNPPVNAIGFKVREGIAKGIEAFNKNDAIKAIIIICKNHTFFSGVDITEFGQPIKNPGLFKVLETLENSAKPVIAAIHGNALGGGLETALVCHFRVAVPKARFGLPEVKLGLLPGAGGTQLLPRLTGPEKALNMITKGALIDSGEALECGLIDELIQGDLKEGARAFAQKCIAKNLPLRRISQDDEKLKQARDNLSIFDDFQKKMARRIRGFEAPLACIQAVKASVTMPFDKGIKLERQLFQELRQGSQSMAQRHNFFAQRKTSKIPDIPAGTPVFDIKKAAVIGAGTMGSGIAMAMVNAGIRVTLIETKQQFLDRSLDLIRRNYEISASKGKMKHEDVEKRVSMIDKSLPLEGAQGADLVVEAVFEDMGVKEQIFSKLDQLVKKDTILASNTSYLDINEIAGFTSNPQNVLGLHFFNPANVMKLLEVVRAEKTSKKVLATVLSLAANLKKIPVIVGVCHGFAGNRMYSKRSDEAMCLIEQGAFPNQVDKVLYDFGFPMGPFALHDLVGIDLKWDKENSSSNTIKERLCEKGRFGLKTGMGYYKYEKNGRKPVHDPEIDQLIMDFSKDKNIERRRISDEEILQRCVYSIINEGAKIIEEGIAIRPSDLDVIWINGYGWPVYRGGPMFYADLIGLDKILETIKKFHRELGDAWKPAPLLKKLVSQGKEFNDLN